MPCPQNDCPSCSAVFRSALRAARYNNRYTARCAAGISGTILVARMINDQIHDKLHPALVKALQNGPKRFHAAVFRCNVHVIRNIIAAVRAGRRIERREPDAVNAELLQIVELLQYPPQIADPVAVSVAEAPGPDLIKNHVLKPSCMTHIHFSPCRSLVSITTILL